jgi:hypothetical protein
VDEIVLSKAMYHYIHYRNFSLCLESGSVPRARQKALGTEKTLAKDFFTKSQLAGSRQRISLPSAIF